MKRKTEYEIIEQGLDPEDLEVYAFRRYSGIKTIRRVRSIILNLCKTNNMLSDGLVVRRIRTGRDYVKAQTVMEVLPSGSES